MDNRTKTQSLIDKWRNFKNVILDPWVIIMLITTSGFFYYSTQQIVDKSFLAVITLIISLASGLLGGIIANRWAQMTEIKILVVRGKSAIRSLKLILQNISKIEKRTKKYIACIGKENKEHKLIISNFEEVIGQCNTLEEEIINSIENWTDIIPEVENMKTQIGLVSEMKLREAKLEGDISNLNAKITAIKEEESKQKKELQKKLSDKESRLSETQQKLNEAEGKINKSVLSGLTYTPGIGTIRISTPLFDTSRFSSCKKCGLLLVDPLLIADGLCDECRNTPEIVLTTNPSE